MYAYQLLDLGALALQVCVPKLQAIHEQYASVFRFLNTALDLPFSTAGIANCKRFGISKEYLKELLAILISNGKHSYAVESFKPQEGQSYRG